MKRIISILLLVFGLVLNVCYGQSSLHPLKGLVVNAHNKEAIPYVNIFCKAMNKGTVSDQEGAFNLGQVKAGQYQLQISSIGYQALDTVLNLEKDQAHILKLRYVNLKLKEVVVIAQESRGSGTSSVIKKDALKHLQPSSFADILELLPGGISQNRSMTSMNLIALRTPLGAASGVKGEYNSSLGTAFIVDGVPLSNDAQLQSISGTVGSGGVIGAHFNRNTTGRGIDMRMLGTDDIEKVEIIRGIPSVRYGSLSSGLVKIERSFKEKQLQLRMKATPTGKLFALGKGFGLGDNTLNVNFDYAKNVSDPRNTLVNFNRLTGSLRYSNSNTDVPKKMRFMVSMDYTGSFDDSKRDEENDAKDEYYKNKYNKFRLSSKLIWKPESSIISDVNINVSSSYTSENKEIQRVASSQFSPILTEREEGEYYGEFLPASYLAYLEVEGKPLSLFSQVNTNLFVETANINHKIHTGIDWRYNKNFGKGQVYDVCRPLYAGNGRPRASKDIPAMEELSIYAEDNMQTFIGEHKLNVQTGLRATTLLNLNKQYTLRGRFYFDPRVNLSWHFPVVDLFGKSVRFSLRSGFGWLTRFPTLSHLYPNKIYRDAVQLNYYSQNKNLRQMHYKTKIIDPTHYNLKPNRNRKWELGLGFTTKKIRFDLTAYKEYMNKGFRSVDEYTSFQYKKYNIESGPKSASLTKPPTIDLFEYKDFNDFWIFSKMKNGAKESKKGIEYQLDLGRVDAIQSRVSINGAWMQMTYGSSAARYQGSQTAIGNKQYPYMGYYTWDNTKEYEQLNTNFRFDTQIESLNLIFSSTFQVLWYTKSKYTPNSGAPDYYFDLNGNKYEFTEADKTDPVRRFLYKKPSPNQFDTMKEPITIDYNLKVSKQINKNISLAFYVNRILHYYPDYKRKDGFRIKREPSPYFGMELHINI